MYERIFLVKQKTRHYIFKKLIKKNALTYLQTCISPQAAYRECLFTASEGNPKEICRKSFEKSLLFHPERGNLLKKAYLFYPERGLSLILTVPIWEFHEYKSATLN